MHGTPRLRVICTVEKTREKSTEATVCTEISKADCGEDGWMDGKASAAFPCRGDGRSAAWGSRRIDAGSRHPCLGVGRDKRTTGQNGTSGKTHPKQTKQKDCHPRDARGSLRTYRCISEIITSGGAGGPRCKLDARRPRCADRFLSRPGARRAVAADAQAHLRAAWCCGCRWCPPRSYPLPPRSPQDPGTISRSARLWPLFS